MYTNRNTEVALTILNQLGGNHFVTMTGSKQFVAGDNYLQMKLARNKSGANRLKIELTWRDDYKMTFSQVRVNRRGEFKIDELVEIDGIYFDQLQNVFSEHTGLYTRL